MRCGGGLRFKYGWPMLVGNVAIDFPGMKVIHVHPGWLWVEESLSMALHKDKRRSPA